MKKWMLVFILGILLTSCAPAAPVVKPTDVPAQPAQAQPQPTAIPQATAVQPAAVGLDGATILENKCADCHSPNRVQQSPGDRAHWEQVVNRMVQKGAVLTEAEKQVLVDFLASKYGK